MSGIVVGSDGVAEDYHNWAATEFGPQINAHAWAAAEPPPPVEPYREQHRWPTALRRAGIWLGVAVAAAGALLCLIHPTTQTASHETGWPAGYSNPPTATPPPDTPDVPRRPFTMPPNIPVEHETHDGAYFQALRAHGWEISDPAQALQAAQIVCNNLAIVTNRPAWTPESHSARSFVAYWMLHDDPTTPPGWTLADTRFLVDIDAQFYCPEY